MMPPYAGQPLNAQICQEFDGVGMTSPRSRQRLIDSLLQQGILHDSRVAQVMNMVPRHLFVDPAFAQRSYEDCALPIGHEQTISHPSTVALMTQWLIAEQPIHKVLEIGTGSGYQTALLSALCSEVYTVERITELSYQAQSRLHQLQVGNVHFFTADGHWGLPDLAPFDAIISAASPETLPPELVAQLKEGGRMVIPIGAEPQHLYGFVRQGEQLQQYPLGDVSFVPMRKGVAQ
ncbi:protein-L-isoaspartate O-methyltransferase [Thiosulfatimonas sediminis]|uniref:Protein-L-isoaspartate O-methyltransferase n=1 Tax=Thiosulfatimonas sediminis TaxID=2675054 RepID=A0A6F8PUX4_9GAMM|nr:protein-L-isoaspartate(D-aspartate) O-methyltransferase [Thiosulfatimonas sediminis]BBP45925.1 protein-L-isoaspartate O-methyltransferase [Thiosulfatimonas sediminis]